ncbi:hypothetical protein MYX65_10225 [Acidobacteria bacterium AH-259-L09]|nr:hypothetical protein [Acidobacteria bacterium AH-259-L09]
MRKVRESKTFFVDTSREQGLALITVLFTLFLFTLLALASVTLGILGVNITSNDQGSAEVLYIADAGIAHAKAIILSGGSTQFDLYLQAGNSIACDGDELSDPPPPPLAAGDAITSAASGGHTFGAGRYEVSVCDDHTLESATSDPPDLPDTDPNHDANGIIRIISTGFGSDGATTTIELIVAAASNQALMIGGNLRISGDPVILGLVGAIRSDGNLDISGNPCVEKYMSAAGSITGSGGTGAGCANTPPVGTDSPADKRPAAQTVAIPLLVPGDFRANADYILKADGSVEDQVGTVLKAPGPGPWGNWDWDPSNSRWITTSTSIPTGTYYSEVSIAVSTNVGQGGPPLPLTLIAEGYVDISGNPHTAPALTLGGTTYAVVAGTDLNIGATLVNSSSALFYANHQLRISGAAQIQGQLIAANQDDLPFPNPGGINLIPLASWRSAVVLRLPSMGRVGSRT